MAYRLLRGGQIVYVHRSSTTTPTGRTSTLTRGEVGRTGTVYEDLPAHVVEQIESGYFKDGTWEMVELVGDEWVAVDQDVDEDGARSDEAELDADRSIDLALELERERTRSADLEAELAKAHEALRAFEPDETDGQAAGGSDSASSVDPSTEHGHEADSDHRHEATFEGLGGERLKELVDAHALSVKGTGAQGKLKNDDMVRALNVEHGFE